MPKSSVRSVSIARILVGCRERRAPPNPPHPGRSPRAGLMAHAEVPADGLSPVDFAVAGPATRGASDGLCVTSSRSIPREALARDTLMTIPIDTPVLIDHRDG